MRLSHPSSGPPRQGVILLVVVLMLTLFMVVGLTFVLYSESAATGSRINKEAQTPDMVDVLPETLLSWGLGKFIYDETDDINGVPSAIRGHSLARLTWGWNYFESSAAMPNPIFTNNNFPSDLTLRNTDPYSRANVTPFNGIGPLRSLAAPPAAAGPGITDYDLVNYIWFAQRDPTTGTPFSIDGMLRDPERAQYRQDASKVPAVNQPLQSYAGGFNVPYTYPDRANMFLATVQTTDPITHQPFNLPRLNTLSFIRETANLHFKLADQNAIQIDPSTPGGQAFWNSPPLASINKTWWKYAVLRPRPGDQLVPGETLMPSPTGNGWIAQNSAGNVRPAFPPPADVGGDVKQLPGVLFTYTYKNANGQAVQAQAQNDSFWMDLNYPVQISRNGKKFKPLFAFLVLDLDGRLNLNMAGNASAFLPGPGGVQIPAHASNQGLGRYEINISKVLNADQTPSTLPAEWRNVFTGSIAVPSNVGRYGQDHVPGYGALTTNNAITDPWAPDLTTNSETLRSLIFPCDIDAVDPANNKQVTMKFTLPFTTFASFPTFSPTGYDNCTFDVTKPQWNPRLNHPLLNQKLRAFGDDLPFGDDNMYSLLAGDYRKSYLYGLIPQNLDGTAAAPTLGMRNRQLFTTRSFDLDMPGMPPWVTSSTASAYQLTPLPGLTTPSVVNATNHPSGQPMATPAPAQMVSLAAQAAKANDNSDFKANDGRANLLSRVDLNRKLTPYFDANGKFVPPLDAQNRPIPQPPASLLTPGLLATNPEYRYYFATNDRQQLAQDIFNRMVQATGAASMGRVQAGTASQPELAAVRWLAQLAVNIVDFVDDDDIITPFVWNPITPNNPNDPANFAPDQISQRVVFGVEAPKLVVNQAYSELQNDPTDTTAATSGAKLPYQYNFWLELYNPMSVASPPTALSTKNPPTADRQDPNKGSQDRLAVQLQRTSQTLGSAYPVYQVQIVDEAKSPSTFLAQPGNIDGSVNPMGVVVQVTSYLPDFNAVAQAPPGSAMPYPDFTFVQPNIGTFIIPTNAGANTPPSNSGFYVMGPDSKHPFNQPQQGGGVTLHPTINLQDQGQTSQVAAATPWGQPKGGTAKNAMTYQYQGPIPMTDPKDMAARKHTVLLRRLACPNLDPNPIDPQTKTLVDQTKPFNPYVTVDYMAGLPTFDAVQYTSQGPAPFNKNMDYQQPTQRSSVGRVQPYNAAVVKVQKSAAPNPVNNTFFQHNSTSPPPAPMSGSTNNQQGGPTLDWPFDWLTFADRPLTNVPEVMNVPTTAPHMLTQAFGFNPITKQRDLSNHLAPWGVQEARIYRALEYFTVGDRSPYPGTLGRVAGKVNLNSTFDAATLDAIIDAQPNSNFFTQLAVQDVWQGNGNLGDQNNNSFLNRKQQTLALPGASQPDKPFMSFAAPVQPAGDPQYPLGSGIANTMAPYPVQVNGNNTPGGTFTPQTGNTPPSIAYTPPEKSLPIPPYILNELLTKIGGHSTNRSNTFAVFLTVGFFEVIDDSSLPVKLGAEITSAGGKAIRHQMFSVVDRTNLAIDAGRALDPGINDPAGRLRQPPTPPTFMSLADGIPAGAGAPTAKGKPATPITIGVNGGLPIDYDGITPVTFKPFQVPPNTAAPTYWPTTSTGQTCQWMFLETGAHQEAVQVTMDATGTKLQLLFPNGAQFSHPTGSMLCTYQPGNPGPQGPIDYGSPQYRAVVPYTYIIQ